ncbi:bifunctional diguanylate cyclase/phosphodiesterase [Kineosporia sp. R_H_3]|uniref:putative bifunctional diguanylate cyclase/phosphodiesterase n=1 Tax=Kineosporia sp. R_H_3 TaxID=1961848 RepID=UPI000B4A8AF0|nr:GGDEF domain-containing phosphodiesterase [Kineosporia sp. R_H_3]
MLRRAVRGLRRLTSQVEAELRGALRVLSPRSTARAVFVVVWVGTLPPLVRDLWGGVAAGGELSRVVIGSTVVVAVVPLLVLPVRHLAGVYLTLAVSAPLVVLGTLTTTRDPALRASTVVMLTMVPVFAFMLWGRRLGLLSTSASVLVVVAGAATGLVPGGLALAMAVCLVNSGLMLGWAAHTAERLEHDPVTGLPNRRALDRRLARDLGRASSGDDTLSLAVLDVAGVRHLNDVHGRAVVDGLLHEVGGVLGRRLPDSAPLFHLGSGEFVVLLAGPRAVAVERLEAARAVPVRDATLSAGLAGAEPGDTVARLLSRAEASLARAKAAGPDRLDPFLVADAVVGELATSLADGRFTVLFQPIVDLSTGTTVAAEALVRWDHPTRGRVGPDEFVPAAERAGLIHDLGRLVLRQTFLAVHAADAAGHRLQRVGVNVSALELQRPDFGDDVLAALADTGFDPVRLVLEVTESAVLGEREEDVVRVLSRLRAHGVRVAIDDFGTGYSSLGRLGRLPVDFLKVDKSFVWTDDPQVRDPLLTAIIRLADSFGLVTVAEGIETWDQAELLLGLGCSMGQGYLFGRPGDLSDLDLPADGAARAVPHPAAGSGGAG